MMFLCSVLVSIILIYIMSVNKDIAFNIANAYRCC